MFAFEQTDCCDTALTLGCAPHKYLLYLVSEYSEIQIILNFPLFSAIKADQYSRIS